MTKHVKPKLEVKAASGSSDDVAIAFDDFMRAFEAFRETNDERLAQIETAVGADVVTTEKMARINRVLDEQKALIDRLALKNARPALETGENRSAVRSEHKQAFDAYIRQGRETGLRAFEKKALYCDAEGEGGYLVPDETANEIGRRLALISPIRAIAGVQNVAATGALVAIYGRLTATQIVV